jgi:ABC-type lipoprotein export system ATPase subunit
MSDPMIKCDNLVKIYKTGETEVMALQGLDLEIARGDICAVIGNSGSGKSTLLNMIGGLDRPSAGSLSVDGIDVFSLTPAELGRYRRDCVGFVWQNNARNLLPYLSARENVELAMLIGAHGQRRISGASRRTADREYALFLLETVGLGHRVDNRLTQLSGGEQQRVAIAIALANRPRLLLADEPTGSVDRPTMHRIMDLFRRMNEELDLTILIVTHDMMLTSLVDRVVAIRDGKASSEFIRRKDFLRELEHTSAQELVESGSHEELVMLDRAGRIQLPEEYLGVLGNRRSLRLERDGERVILSPPAQSGEDRESSS